MISRIEMRRDSMDLVAAKLLRGDKIEEARDYVAFRDAEVLLGRSKTRVQATQSEVDAFFYRKENR